MRKNEERVGLRLGGVLRKTLEREAAEQGITLSEHIRWLLLVTHPHVTPFEDIARIEASAQKSGATGSDSVPYLVNMQRRLEEGLQALQGLEALTTQWRETSARELSVKINYVKKTIRVWSAQDETATPMKKGFERQEGGHAGSC